MTISPPLISVVIPVYNRQDYLEECVRSALNQTFKNIEVIITDNASTDGTWDICRRLASEDSRVKVFRNAKNVGPVKNWLVGLNEANAPVTKILFSDDTLAPTFFERTLPFLDDPSVAFIYTAALVGVSPQSAVIMYNETRGRRGRIDYLLASLFTSRVPLSPGAALFRTVDLRKNLTWDIPSWNDTPFAQHGAGPDLLLYLLTACEYEHVVALDEPLVFFRAHAGSISIERSSTTREAYRQTKAWFTKRYLGLAAACMLVLKEWLLESIHRRQLTSPLTFINRYLRPNR